MGSVTVLEMYAECGTGGVGDDEECIIPNNEGFEDTKTRTEANRIKYMLVFIIHFVVTVTVIK